MTSDMPRTLPLEAWSNEELRAIEHRMMKERSKASRHASGAGLARGRRIQAEIARRRRAGRWSER